MTEVERRVDRTVVFVLHHCADRIAEKAYTARPRIAADPDVKEPLASRHQNEFAHLAYPPESA